MVSGTWSICVWHTSSRKSLFYCIPPNRRGHGSLLRLDSSLQTVTLTFIRSSRNDQSRKRPLIVFDGSSSNSGPVKVKKLEGAASSGVADRLKPPPAANLTNPIRKLSSSSMTSSASPLPPSTDSANLKKEGNSLVGTSVLLSFVNSFWGQNTAVWFSQPCLNNNCVTEWCKRDEAGFFISHIWTKKNDAFFFLLLTFSRPMEELFLFWNHHWFSLLCVLYIL